MRITLDTNVLPADDLIGKCGHRDWEFAIISVTAREVNGTSFQVHTESLDRVPETWVLGESPHGMGALGAPNSNEVLNRILSVISNGSFPSKRESLSAGQLNQLRDAMILEAHIRSGRDILVTVDERAFISHGRREKLEGELSTRIMNCAEFEEFCRQNT